MQWVAASQCEHDWLEREHDKSTSIEISSMMGSAIVMTCHRKSKLETADLA